MLSHELLQTALNLGYELAVELKKISDNILERKVNRLHQPDAPELEEIDVLKADIDDLTLCTDVLKSRAAIRELTTKLAKVQFICFYSDSKDSSRIPSSKHALESDGHQLTEALKKQFTQISARIPPHEQLLGFKTLLKSTAVRSFLGSSASTASSGLPPLSSDKLSQNPNHQSDDLSDSPATSPRLEDDLAPSIYHSVYEDYPAKTDISAGPSRYETNAMLNRAQARLASLRASPEDRSQAPGSISTPLLPSETASATADELLWAQNDLDRNYLGSAACTDRTGRRSPTPRRVSSSSLRLAHGPSSRPSRRGMSGSTSLLPPLDNRQAFTPDPMVSPSRTDPSLDPTDDGSDFFDEDNDHDGSPSLTPLTEYEVSTDPGADQQIFATQVTVTNPVRIGFGLNSYIVYKCRAIKTDGSEAVVHRRYTDFENLRKVLTKYFRAFRKGIPKLPEKKVIGNFEREFLEHRQHGLQYFLSYVVLHPIIGTSPIIRKWFNLPNRVAS
ncbi:hypothetical protein BJ085DRAFT_34964 [Dimargaris cristalligena]|uniref:PX domain-containing protein n=1 Tax=Dimargaris cristalligena TaxID=215637 RepID=A0A4Q0A1L9_9FUNG|nr:hypothetical protein BJ085DRAFT_34964 [Dimargaris cristalligena]|eukprot:RKP39944.1 hypothetical protein BJ085DRAFT_34964 [Dimargaris cristalligena]